MKTTITVTLASLLAMSIGAADAQSSWPTREQIARDPATKSVKTFEIKGTTPRQLNGPYPPDGPITTNGMGSTWWMRDALERGARELPKRQLEE